MELIMAAITTLRALKRRHLPVIAAVLAVPTLAGGIALAAQDRFTVQVPDGSLSFADFRGYEDWKNVAVSQTPTLLKVILANDVMMAAYKSGLPADGKLFPDGSKIVKIEWIPKKNAVSPYPVNVPDVLKSVDVIEKDTKRFPDTHGWAYAEFAYDPATDTFKPSELSANSHLCGYTCHTTVAAQDYTFTAYPKH
jgi:hypothetical protein